MTGKDNNKSKKQEEESDDFDISQFTDFELPDKFDQQSSSWNIGDIPNNEATDENQTNYEESPNADGSYGNNSQEVELEQDSNDDDNLKENFKSLAKFYKESPGQFCILGTLVPLVEFALAGAFVGGMFGMKTPSEKFAGVTNFNEMKSRFSVGAKSGAKRIAAIFGTGLFVECYVRSLRQKNDVFNSVIGFGIAGIVTQLKTRQPVVIVVNGFFLASYGAINYFVIDTKRYKTMDKIMSYM